MPENGAWHAQVTCSSPYRCAGPRRPRRGVGPTGRRGVARRAQRVLPSPIAAALPNATPHERRPTLHEDEDPVVVLNGVGDRLIDPADVDGHTRYRLLIEDRYPDVFVLEEPHARHLPVEDRDGEVELATVKGTRKTR